MTLPIQTCFNRQATNNFDKHGFEIELDKYKMPFGKWKDDTILTIETNDPDYIYWLNGYGNVDWRKVFDIHSMKNEKLKAAIEYSFLRLYNKKNKTDIYYTYLKQLNEYHKQLLEYNERKKEKKEEDNRARIIPRLLHLKKKVVTSN